MEIEKNKIYLINHFNLNSKYVNIYETFSYKNKIKKFGINWPAIGTVDILTTKKFIKELNQAILLVKTLK